MPGGGSGPRWSHSSSTTGTCTGSGRSWAQLSRAYYTRMSSSRSLDKRPRAIAHDGGSRCFTFVKKCLNRFAGCPTYHDSRDGSGEGGGGAKTGHYGAPGEVPIRQAHRDRQGSFRHRAEVPTDVSHPVHVRE